MSIMTVIGATCAALAIINGLGALFCSWHGQIAPSLLMSLNFAFLGALVQIGIFG